VSWGVFLGASEAACGAFGGQVASSPIWGVGRVRTDCRADFGGNRVFGAVRRVLGVARTHRRMRTHFVQTLFYSVWSPFGCRAGSGSLFFQKLWEGRAMCPKRPSACGAGGYGSKRRPIVSGDVFGGLEYFWGILGQKWCFHHHQPPAAGASGGPPECNNARPRSCVCNITRARLQRARHAVPRWDTYKYAYDRIIRIQACTARINIYGRPHKYTVCASLADSPRAFKNPPGRIRGGWPRTIHL